MNDGDAAIIKQMIEDLDGKIETARRHSLDFAARLLDMARLELLTGLHGIEPGEFEAFCDTLARGHDLQPQRRSVTIGNVSPRRARGARAKPRRVRRSAGPGV